MREVSDWTYKIKCRSCGEITEMWLAKTDQLSSADVNKWASEHSTFPFKKQCECDRGSMLFHDLVSIGNILSLLTN